MRKLTVKNFSVIKDAELEFRRITVLIGPQAEGKSLLCKLGYFLGAEIIGFAVDSLLDRNSWDEYLKTVVREFNSRFATNGWLKNSTFASFESQQYKAELRGVGAPFSPGIEFTFSDAFHQLYTILNNKVSLQAPYKNMGLGELRQELWIQFSLLINKRRTQTNVYIPSGRSFFTVTAKSVSVLQNLELDWITRRFANQAFWDTRWKIGLPSASQGVARDIETEMDRIARGHVEIVESKPLFMSPDGRSLPLSLLSSGTQELLPMFSTMNYLAFHQEHFYARRAATRIPPLADVIDYSPFIYLEEPESNVFPETQRELIQLFAWLSSDPVLSFDWVLTTHSPYVLSVFGDLVKAGTIGAQSAGHHVATAKVIPEKYWIKESDFASYKIENSRLVPIFDRKSGQIDGDFLDSVSGKLSDEFGQLLEIQYGS